jgi:hypothetical protein
MHVLQHEHSSASTVVTNLVFSPRTVVGAPAKKPAGAQVVYADKKLTLTDKHAGGTSADHASNLQGDDGAEDEDDDNEAYILKQEIQSSIMEWKNVSKLQTCINEKMENDIENRVVKQRSIKLDYKNLCTDLQRMLMNM